MTAVADLPPVGRPPPPTGNEPCSASARTDPSPDAPPATTPDAATAATAATAGPGLPGDELAPGPGRPLTVGRHPGSDRIGAAPPSTPVASPARAAEAREPDTGSGATTHHVSGTPAAHGGRPGDAVGWADGVRAEVAERIGAVLDAGVDGVRDIFVGWVAAVDVAGCPARYRAGGADGWGFPGWSPALAAGSVARAALVRHLDRTSSPVAGPTLPPPLEAVRDWLREAQRAPACPVAEWIAELGRDGDRDTVAATAANATRWLAGFVRVMGWPLPERLGVVVDSPEGPHGRGWSKRWRPVKGSPVCVASSPDAVLGKVSPAGRFDLVVHRPSTPTDEAMADRAAFEAAAGALASGIVPTSILVTTADTGEHARFPIAPALLERGVELIVEVVHQRLVSADAVDAAEPDDATPSPACRWCPHLDDCAAGQAWLAGPGRWRAGLPVLGLG